MLLIIVVAVAVALSVTVFATWRLPMVRWWYAAGDLFESRNQKQAAMPDKVNLGELDLEELARRLRPRVEAYREEMIDFQRRLTAVPFAWISAWRRHFPSRT